MDAEDAVQETLLRAAINHGGLDQDRISGWLTAVTIRLCVDSHRQRERESRHWGRAPGDPSPRAVDEEVCERDWAIWAASHIDRLPPRQRAALLLKADGHDTGTVARRLGVSPRSAESLLARARRTLRSVLLPAVVGVAALWYALTRLTVRKAVLAASGASAVVLTGLVFVQGGLSPHQPTTTESPTVPVHAPSRAASPPEPTVTGSRFGNAMPADATTSDTPTSSTPQPVPSTAPVPLLPDVAPAPLPEPPLLVSPSVTISPGLPLPTLDKFLPLRRKNLPAA
jgi:RNA polymerase sigma factor (sigma-70 family)